MAELVSIIVLSRDRWPKLRRRLELLRRRAPAGAYELLVFDNASSDGTLAGLCGLQKRWPALRVFHNDANLPFAAAVNRGMAKARGSYFLWLNDDVEVTPGWLDGLLAAVESDGGVVAAGPMTGRMAPAAQIAKPFENRPSARTEETEFLGGFCFLVKREAAESVGLLDERFVWGWEDMDYCLRLRHAGGRLVLAKDVFVRHEGSETIRTLPPATRARDDLRNRKLIARKWPRSSELRALFNETPAPWHPSRPKASILLACPDPRRARARSEALRRRAGALSFEILKGASLNRLAARAEGDHLVVLGERARVETGWLESLLTLLPSGGVVVGEGGTLVVPRKIFERVGRFDERFAASSAVVDYCLRCRQEGAAVSGPMPAPDTTDAAALLSKWAGQRVFEAEVRRTLKPSLSVIAMREDDARPWARRLNRALEENGAEHFLVVSEGVRPTPAAVERLRRASALEPNIAVVGPRGSAWHDGSGAGPIGRSAHLRSFCFLIPRKMFERIGPFDERFAGPLALTDYCFRAHQLGLQVVVAKDAVVRPPRRAAESRRAKDFPLLFSKWSGYELFEAELVS